MENCSDPRKCIERMITKGDISIINPLKHIDSYSGRTAPLSSKFCILYMNSTNIVLNILNTIYTLRFCSSKCSLFHNSNIFRFWFFTYYLQGVINKKKYISGAKKIMNKGMLFMSLGKWGQTMSVQC